MGSLDVMKERRNILAKRLLLEKQYSAEVRAHGGLKSGIPPPPPFEGPNDDELNTSDDGFHAPRKSPYTTTTATTTTFSPLKVSSGGGSSGALTTKMGHSVERQLRAAGVSVPNSSAYEVELQAPPTRPRAPPSSSSSSSSSSNGSVNSDSSNPNSQQSSPKIKSLGIYADNLGGGGDTDSDDDDFNMVYKNSLARARRDAPMSSPTQVRFAPGTDGGLTSGTEDDIPVEKVVAGNFGHYTEGISPARRPSGSDLRKVHFVSSKQQQQVNTTGVGPVSALVRQQSLSASHMKQLSAGGGTESTKAGEDEWNTTLHAASSSRRQFHFTANNNNNNNNNNKSRADNNSYLSDNEYDALGRPLKKSPIEFPGDRRTDPPPCCSTPCCVIN